jgi:hypothetical protein
MMQLPHIKARVARLHELTRALRKEIVVIKDADDPLLFMERRRYLDAMYKAVAELDTARVVLAGVAGRLESQAAAPAGQ